MAASSFSSLSHNKIITRSWPLSHYWSDISGLPCPIISFTTMLCEFCSWLETRLKEWKNMPLSKAGNLYYTEEQFQKARYDSSALEYARAQGYSLIQKGKYFTLAEHDSMVFTDQGSWFWNSRQLKGGALEFMTTYEHKTFVESVLILSGENILTQESAQTYESKEPSPQSAENSGFPSPYAFG